MLFQSLVSAPPKDSNIKEVSQKVSHVVKANNKVTNLAWLPNGGNQRRKSKPIKIAVQREVVSPKKKKEKKKENVVVSCRVVSCCSYCA